MIPMEKAVWNQRRTLPLLTSHSFFLTQMKNQFLNEKNTGDTVVSTLNANLQSIAYNALG